MTPEILQKKASELEAQYIELLMRRSPVHMPGARANFYANQIAGCAIVQASMRKLHRSMGDASLIDVGVMAGLQNISWQVNALSDAAKAKLDELDRHPAAVHGKLEVGQ